MTDTLPLDAFRLLASRQGGYVGRKQAIAAGTALDALLADGSIRLVEADLFRLVDHPADRFDALARGCARTGGVVSHQSAAQVYGMGDCRPHFVHLSCGGAVGASGATAVHRRELRSEDIVDAGSFRITTPLRTVYDLADSPLAQHVLDAVIADAIMIGRVDADELRGAIRSQPTRTAERLACALQAGIGDAQ